MSQQQASPETTLKKTLFVLHHHLNLTPEQLSQLHLADLHLAGKTPHLNFKPAADAQAKKIELDMEVHRALVAWLVARPDSVSDFLFINSETEPLSGHEVKLMIEAGEQLVDSRPQETADAVTSRHKPAPVPKPTSDEPTTAHPPRPGPPPFGPERGSPPAQTGSFPPPPATAPEEDDLTDQTMISSRFRPPGQPERPPRPPAPASRPEPLQPAKPPYPPRPVDKGKPRTPPKPIRRRTTPVDPTLLRQDPDQTLPPASSQPVVPPFSPESLQADETLAEEMNRTAAPGPASAASPPEETTPLAASDEPERQAAPLRAEAVLPEEKARLTGPPASPESPAPWKPRRPKRKIPGPAPETTRVNRRAMLPTALGGLVLFLLGCVVCPLLGGWYVWQSEPGAQLLADLGLVGETQTMPATGEAGEADSAAAGETDLVFESPLSPLNSPLPTPTLPATSTPTPSVTPTPLPSNTPTPAPSPTAPLPTATLTNTPPPTETPTPEPPPATATPAATPTPAETPTPAMKYGAPVLVGPDDGTDFTGVNEIVLRWQPVGELAPDEQYAVRIVYQFNGQVTYGGANVKEPQWVVPMSLYRQIDPPENRYEWFVVVERVNEDGSGTAISPESGRWSFTWK